MSKTCPRCGSYNVRRSSYPSAGEAGLHAFESPYRCRNCRDVFWVMSRHARHMMIGALVILIASPTLVFLIVTQTPHVSPPESRIAASAAAPAEAKDAVRSGN